MVLRDPGSKRGRGRPKGSAKVPRDCLQDIWVGVELVRTERRRRVGRPPSVTRACQVIAERGGMWWIVGGDIGAIASAVANNSHPPYSDWRRFTPMGSGRRIDLRNDDSGRVVVCHKIQDAKTLRNRYVEANRLARHNSAVLAAWTGMVRDALGSPRLAGVALRAGVSRASN